MPREPLLPSESPPPGGNAPVGGIGEVLGRQGQISHVVTRAVQQSGQTFIAQQQLSLLEETDYRKRVREVAQKSISIEEIQEKFNADKKGELKATIMDIARDIAQEMNIPRTLQETVEQIAIEIADDILGFGKLQPLIDDPAVNEIWAMAKEDNQVMVFAQFKDGTRRQINIKMSVDYLSNLLEQIARIAGKPLGTSKPIIDAWLPDGSRISASIAPAHQFGGQITIRKFVDILTVNDLVNRKVLNQPILKILEAIAQAGLSVIVGGPVGTGKTTFINVISQYIPDSRSIIVIQDNPEIKIQAPMTNYFLVREGDNVDAIDAISWRRLTRHSVRNNLDALIIGEVRDTAAALALEMAIAGVTIMTTLHAGDATGTIARLFDLASSDGNVRYTERQVLERIAHGIKIIIICSRREYIVTENGEQVIKRQRYIKSISEIGPLQQGRTAAGEPVSEIVTNDLFRYDPIALTWHQVAEPTNPDVKAALQDAIEYFKKCEGGGV